MQQNQTFIMFFHDLVFTFLVRYGPLATKTVEILNSMDKYFIFFLKFIKNSYRYFYIKMYFLFIVILMIK